MEFKSNFKVYYEDTDSGGVVYYANYLKFLERARTDAITSVNFSNKILIEAHKPFLVNLIIFSAFFGFSYIVPDL